MRSAIICDFTQRRVVIPYRRFWPTYRTQHQGSASSSNSMPTCRNLTVEMGLTICPKTSVRNYHVTTRKIPHKRGFQVLHSCCVLVWFGLFVHPLSHIRNIGHVNYRLKFTTHLIIYGHSHNTI